MPLDLDLFCRESAIALGQRFSHFNKFHSQVVCECRPQTEQSGAGFLTYSGAAEFEKDRQHRLQAAREESQVSAQDNQCHICGRGCSSVSDCVATCAPTAEAGITDRVSIGQDKLPYRSILCVRNKAHASFISNHRVNIFLALILNYWFITF